MDETLTIEEIEGRFPSEWVLIGDPATDSNQKLTAGRLSSTVATATRWTANFSSCAPRRFAFRYTGDLPEHMAMVL